MPPSTTIGNGISHAVSLTAPTSSPIEKSRNGVRLPRLTHKEWAAMQTIMRAPGMMPAINSSSIGISATTPYRISGSDGANNSPRLPAEVTSPSVKRSP